MQGGPLPIPFAELQAYCEFYRIDSLEQRSSLARHIAALDDSDRSRIHEMMNPATKTDTEVDK